MGVLKSTAVRAWGLVLSLGLAAMLGQSTFAASLSAGAPGALPLPEHDVVLEVHGRIARTNVGAAAHFDMELLHTLPPAQLRTTTAVTDGVRHFEGFLMRDLLALLGAEGVRVTASDLDDYTIDTPLVHSASSDSLVAHTMDDEILLPSDKGPLWLVYPRDQHEVLQDIRYDCRWVWQLDRLEVR